MPVEIQHRAFLLLPADEDRSFTEYHLRHRRAARELTGMPFHLPDVGAPYPRSSLPALQAAAWVQEHHPDCFDAFDLSVYEAFFRETRDISDAAVLGDLAESLGLDPEGPARAVAEGGYRSRVFAQYEESVRAGVNGIPTVRIGGAQIAGAVPYEEYLRAARFSRTGEL